MTANDVRRVLPPIMRHASEAGIDTKVLRSALADGSAQAFLAETESAGARFGVQATEAWSGQQLSRYSY